MYETSHAIQRSGLCRNCHSLGFSTHIGADSMELVLLRDGRVMLFISGHSHMKRKAVVDHMTVVSETLGYG